MFLFFVLIYIIHAERFCFDGVAVEVVSQIDYLLVGIVSISIIVRWPDIERSVYRTTALSINRNIVLSIHRNTVCIYIGGKK